MGGNRPVIYTESTKTRSLFGSEPPTRSCLKLVHVCLLRHMKCVLNFVKINSFYGNDARKTIRFWTWECLRQLSITGNYASRLCSAYGGGANWRRRKQGGIAGTTGLATWHISGGRHNWNNDCHYSRACLTTCGRRSSLCWTSSWDGILRQIGGDHLVVQEIESMDLLIRDNSGMQPWSYIGICCT